MARHGGTIPSKNRAFTTLVDPGSPPSTPSPKVRRKMVEAPGTAPGSETLIPRGVYRHSRFPDDSNIGARMDFLKVGKALIYLLDGSPALPQRHRIPDGQS